MLNYKKNCLIYKNQSEIAEIYVMSGTKTKKWKGTTPMVELIMLRL